MENHSIGRDVRILRFCALRILRRIRHPVQNLGSCAELRKIYQMAQKVRKFFLIFVNRFTYYRVTRSPVFSGSSRISAPISRLPDKGQNLPHVTRRSLASKINVLETFCSLLVVHSTVFLVRQHTDARYWYNNSVHLSVTSRYWIKRLNMSS